MRHDLILRNVRPMGDALVDVAISDGVIRAIGPRLDATGPDLDGGGHALIPGLIDHHIHVLATAARRDSVDLSGMRDSDRIVQRLRGAASDQNWVRAIHYDEAAAGLPDRWALDGWMPNNPLRMQDRTGALWMLNSRAVAALGEGPFPEGVILDAGGVPTGHIWRSDAWLRAALANEPPSLLALGQELARYGVTGLTDASAHNGPAEAALLAALPQRLMVMGGAALLKGSAWQRGALKLLFDERDPPDPADIAARIVGARQQHRAVAAHCVTAGELLLYLAALDLAGGARPGDRIEHGADIPAGMIAEIASLGLTVITQPAFIHDRGDRYLAEIDAHGLSDLWRLGSLLNGGVKVAAGSDAPYGSQDPWLAIRTAISRRTASGGAIGAGEAIATQAALALYLGPFADPGGPPRQIAVGEAADLCLLGTSWRDCLHTPHRDAVRATIIGGRMVAGM
jgi:predicted amidohydrolase YtcJ